MATVKKSNVNKAGLKKSAEKNNNSCLCGCGGRTGSRFAPGHDMRLKGQLKRAAEGPSGLSIKQQRLIAELGWEKYIDGGKVKPLKKSDKAPGHPTASATTTSRVRKQRLQVKSGGPAAEQASVEVDAPEAEAVHTA